ncbi:hypothetical protein [Geodermatophilus sp. SYSU D01176]
MDTAVQPAPAQAETGHTPGILLVTAATLFLAMWVPILIPEWTWWAQPMLTVVPALLAAITWRVSRTVAVYLSVSAIYFGVTSTILGTTVSALAVSTVLAWSASIATGARIGMLVPSRQRVAEPASPPSWPHVTAVVALQVVHAFLVVTDQAGYSAQLAHGRLNPAGLLGAMSTASPVITLVLVFTALATGHMARLALTLGASQATILTASGLRGAGILFVVALIIGSLVVLPEDSPWRHPRRILVAALTAAVLVGTMFTLAAVVKNRAASEAGFSSSGTQLVTSDTVVETVARRLDLSSYLERALEYRDVDRALDAISLTDQARAVIPRFLWPDKPQVDYGPRVAQAFFGATSDRTSSTITTVGDTRLNLGSVMPLAGMALGLILCRLERRVRGGHRGLTYVVAAILTYRLVSQESPLLSLAIDSLRDLLVVSTIWLACDLAARPRDQVSARSSSG